MSHGTAANRWEGTEIGRQRGSDALEFEALAKRRLAEEDDATQACGEVASSGQRGPTKAVDDTNSFSPATASELGLRHDQIYDARLTRDSEEITGLVRSTREAAVGRRS